MKRKLKVSGDFNPIYFHDQMAEINQISKESIVIYDRKLLSAVPNFKKWLKKYPKQYAVSGGEKLKSVDEFPKHIKKLITLTDGISKKEITFVAVGGGSVGDFAGFVASIVKRGVKFIQIPSTWLAVIDSSHGGKTALNVEGKNQIGTFYPAQKIYVVKELLWGQTKGREQDALGELIKISVIDGAGICNKMLKSKKEGKELIWHVLPEAIQAKYKVVEQDPLEETGVRHLLNYGHTLGHIIESHYNISHGLAVSVGLSFSTQWSFEKKKINEKQYKKISNFIDEYLQEDIQRIKHKCKPMTRLQFLKYPTRDKKKSSNREVRFIFPIDFGRMDIEDILLEDLYLKAKNEGWVR